MAITDEKTGMNWYLNAKTANSDGDDDALWREIEDAGPRKPTGKNPIGEFFDRRRDFTKRYSWAIPSRIALGKLKDWIGGRNVIEIGGGRGLWSRLLRGMGVSVQVSDATGTKENSFLKDLDNDEDEGSEHTWTDVMQMRGEEHAAMGGEGDVLMMVWPYFEAEGEKDWQEEALKAFRGRGLIFVGEMQGGATGTPGLWKEIERSWKHVGVIDIPTWDMIRDRIYLFERK